MAIKEIWKTVPNYEGEYEVSSKGRVRSVKAKRPDKGHILKAYRNKRNGYLYLALSKKWGGTYCSCPQNSDDGFQSPWRIRKI